MITLIPPLVAIVLAFITKNVVISLFVGIFSGSFIINMSLNSLAGPWNAGIILQVLAIGGVISLVARMDGVKAIAESLAKRSKTARGTQLIAWFLGLLVFFDDYANSLIVGPIVRPVADKMKLSREKLAFIIDATA